MDHKINLHKFKGLSMYRFDNIINVALVAVFFYKNWQLNTEIYMEIQNI